MDHSEYCREIEAHLCRKNGGHLIRIVGPAFELVHGWAEQGVPLKVAIRGIDQHCDRASASARGARRRPVRVEFCEADVLDLFDDWRRAVGVSSANTGESGPGERSPRRTGLAAHIERAIARLLAARPTEAQSGRFGSCVDAVVRELDGLMNDARHARGEARARVIERLDRLDADLLTAAVEELEPARAEALKREAHAELAPFGSRMAAEARDRAAASAFNRLVREGLGVPSLHYE